MVANNVNTLLRPHWRVSIYGDGINERYPTLFASPSYPIVGATRALAHSPGFVEATAPFAMLTPDLAF